MSAPMPAAWYPDPSTPGQLRWWDGTQWTENVSPQQGAPTAGAPQAAAPQQGAPAPGAPQAGYGTPQQGYGQAAFAQQAGKGFTSTTGVFAPYAEFWQRAVALIIDGIIIAIPTFIIFAVFGASGGYGVGGSFGATFLLAAIIVVAINAAYFIYLIGTQGQTIGMRVMSIKVVTADGAIPGLETSGRRWIIPGGLAAVGLLPVIGILASLAGLINYLSMLWDDQNQCFHDKFAETWVVKAN